MSTTNNVIITTTTISSNNNNTTTNQQLIGPSVQLIWGIDPSSSTPNEPILYLERRLTKKQIENIERRKKLTETRFGKATKQVTDAYTTISNSDVFIDDPDDDFQAQSFAFHGGGRKMNNKNLIISGPDRSGTNTPITPRNSNVTTTTTTPTPTTTNTPSETILQQ
jgi:hypothetical protein